MQHPALIKYLQDERVAHLSPLRNELRRPHDEVEWKMMADFARDINRFADREPSNGMMTSRSTSESGVAFPLA